MRSGRMAQTLSLSLSLSRSLCLSCSAELTLACSLLPEHPPSTSAHSLDRVTLSPQQLALCLEHSDICSQFLDTPPLSMPIL